MTYQEFAASVKEILQDDSPITVGNDMTVNTRITVREDGQVFITEADSFRRAETNININRITERRKETDWAFYYFIDDADRALAIDTEENEIYYCYHGQPSGWGSAFQHFTRFPVDERHSDDACTQEHKRLCHIEY